MLPVALFVVKEVNRWLLDQAQKCAQLGFHRILAASELFAETGKLYLLSVQVTPSNAILEATVALNSGRMSIVGDVSRTNRYGNQSHCVAQNAHLKKFCFCL
jgi:uncharacterized membrane protein